MTEFPYLEDQDVVEVQRGPEPGGAGGAYRAFGETLRGLKTTMARLHEEHVVAGSPGHVAATTTIAVTSAFSVASGSSTFQPKLMSWS